MPRRYTVILLTLFSFAMTMAKEKSSVPSVVDTVFSISDSISGKPWHYKARYYYRGMLALNKKNLSILSAPNRRYYMRGHRELLTEDIGEVEYSAPDVFARNVRYTYGSELRNRVAHTYIIDFFNIKLYDTYLLGDHILSPLHSGNASRYIYAVDSLSCSKTYVSFRAKRKSMQTVEGHFVYDSLRHIVTEMTFSGEYNFVAFTEHVVMGTEGMSAFWPVKAVLDFKYWYYGNRFAGSACYVPEYTLLEDEYDIPRHCDMTERYAVMLDSVKAMTDSVRIASLRPIPLSDDEKRIYHESAIRKEQRKTSGKEDYDSKTPFWMRQVGYVGEAFFHSHNIVKTENTQLRVMSPNIGYTGRNGVTFRQDMEFRQKIGKGRSLSVKPSASYLFGRKELTGRTTTELLLAPRHNGMLRLEGGIQSIMSDRERLRLPLTVPGDTLGVPNILEFHDLFLYADAMREVANGLDIAVGLRMHNRIARGFAAENRDALGLKSSYRDVASHITVTFTPRQQYYRERYRKVRTTSTWPTFLASFERGIKGLLGSTNKYEKYEAMATQDIRLSPHRRMIWKAGWGMFTSRYENRFVQYEYFNNGISTYNWDDDRSGVFQLLDWRYYNNSNHYLRGHIVLESPTLLLGKMNTRLVRCERLYVNTLACEHLVPYLEIGYGISNALFDISLFSSYTKKENMQLGVKASLSLFD